MRRDHQHGSHFETPKWGVYALYQDEVGALEKKRQRPNAEDAPAGLIGLFQGLHLSRQPSCLRPREHLAIPPDC